MPATSWSASRSPLTSRRLRPPSSAMSPPARVICSAMLASTDIAWASPRAEASINAASPGAALLPSGWASSAGKVAGLSKPRRMASSRMLSSSSSPSLIEESRRPSTTWRSAPTSRAQPACSAASSCFIRSVSWLRSRSALTTEWMKAAWTRRTWSTAGGSWAMALRRAKEERIVRSGDRVGNGGAQWHVFDAPMRARPRQEFGGRGTLQRRRRPLAQHGKRCRQHGALPRNGQGGRERLLGKLLPRGIGDERHVRVDRSRQAELALQIDLARRVRQEVGAAHDVRDALEGVIDHDGQLVGEQTVGTPDDEIADVVREVLLQLAVDTVVKTDVRIGHAHPPGARD